MKAVIVDDSRAILLILGTILRDLGFEVIKAKNGSEALEQLRTGEKPDLVLLDWNMPEMDGFEVLQVIRAEPTWNDVPVMMVSSNNEVDYLSRALAAGADEYIMKPFSREMILKKLEILGIPLP